MQFSYSNTNYFLLAQIIENLTAPSATAQGDYRQYLRNRIFSRAGMTATGFIDDPVQGYPVAPPNLKRTAVYGLPAWPKGAGEIATNVMDMAMWDTNLLAGNVISSSSLQTMLTPVAFMPPPPGPPPGPPPQFYAMGWEVRQFPIGIEYAHDGSIPGYTAQNLIVSATGGANKGAIVTVTILTNADDVQLYGVASRLAQLVVH